MKKTKLGILFAVTATSLALFTACASKEEKKDAKGELRLASKGFTENEIVAEVYSLALQDAGYDVERVPDVSSAVIHTSLVNGEVDLYPEYTGTGLISVLGMEPQTDEKAVYETVKTEYDKQFSVTWLDYAPANDGQGLAIRTEVAKKYGISTISDLQKNADKIRFASQGEFDIRSDGIPALEATYGKFAWKSSKVYDNALKYQVLENDEADVTPVYTTEGKLTEEEFTLLEDDKHVWPPYNLAPIVRNETLEKYPDVADVLNKISEQLTTKELTKLNAKVDIDKEEVADVADVAEEFYDSINK